MLHHLNRFLIFFHVVRVHLLFFLQIGEPISLVLLLPLEVIPLVVLLGGANARIAPAGDHCILARPPTNSKTRRSSCVLGNAAVGPADALALLELRLFLLLLAPRLFDHLLVRWISFL